MLISKATTTLKLLILMCGLALTQLTFARSAELKDPTPVAIPAGLTQAQAQLAVKAAIVQKGWRLASTVSESPLVEETEYRVQNHMMALTLTYSAESISFKYSRSENLNYKVGKKKTEIHPNYMVWTQQLADQITANLAQGSNLKFDESAIPTAGNQPPKEAFSKFDKIEFEAATLDKSLPTKKKNVEGTRRNLDHSILVAFEPKQAIWNKSDAKRPLLVKTHIRGLKFVGGATRFMVGAMAGRSWMHVELTFVDKNTGKTIGTAALYRVADMANGFTLARADYAMVENMGKDIIDYIQSNYDTPVGGGTLPPPSK